jgi:hypothetical protein
LSGGLSGVLCQLSDHFAVFHFMGCSIGEGAFIYKYPYPLARLSLDFSESSFGLLLVKKVFFIGNI